jgi:hypothetical protein
MALTPGAPVRSVSRVAWALALGVLLARTPATLAQASASDTFVLHINRPIDPSCLSVTSFVRGPFGGYSNYGQRLPTLQMSGSQDIVVDTTRSGQSATFLRLVVYCRGYQFAFVEVASLLEPGARKKAIDLVPLATVPMRGRVTLPSGDDPSQFTVEIGFDASALAMKYLLDPRGSPATTGGVAGSFVSSSTSVAEVVPAADGAFVALVPDFARDPAAAASPGRFDMFFARGPRRSYALSVVTPSGLSRLLPQAPAYDGVVQLRPSATRSPPQPKP